MFRYERPQAGRYRQHHQAGVEFFGSASPAADAEVISLGLAFLSAAGLPALSVGLNSIGCRACRPAYLAELRAYLASRVSSLCGDCKERAEKNPLRALDCKVEGCQGILDGAPRQGERLCEACRSHHAGVEGILKTQGLSFRNDPRLVRGFDYYTRTVFEVKSENLGAQNTVLGGGRYDHLVEDFGGPAVPAVGFGSGMERLLSLLPGAPPGDLKKVAIVTLGDKARALAPALAAQLRGKGGLSVVWDDLAGGPGAQLKKIGAWGYDYALILGDDEVAKGTAMVKNLATGVQVEQPRGSLEL
jgi:histidyl-tRNA synthetase